MNQKRRRKQTRVATLNKQWLATRAGARRKLSLNTDPLILTEAANVIAFDLGIRIRTLKLVANHKAPDQDVRKKLLRHLGEMKKEVGFCHKLNLFLLARLK